MDYPAALLSTVLLEAALVLVLAPRSLRGQVLLPAVLVNALTHPIAASLLAGEVAHVVALEVGVILVEALGYRVALGSTGLQALRLAALANAVTWALSYFA